jgi:DNA-binding MarR family transcriptional regulator
MLDGVDENILKVLSTSKKSSEIAKEIGVSKPTVVAHLKKLEGLGLVKKEGGRPQTKYRIA